MNVIYDNPIYMGKCFICQSIKHQVSDCLTIPTMREMLVQNHLNMAWNFKQEQFSSS